MKRGSSNGMTMPNINSLRQDVEALLIDALKAGQMGVSDVLGEAARKGASGGSRVAFPILDAIDRPAEGFIEAAQRPYRSVVCEPGTDIAAANAVIIQALDRYLETSQSWGRAPLAFSADGRNALLDRDYPERAGRLRQRLQMACRVSAHDVKPKSFLTRNLPVLAFAVTVIGVLAAIVANFVWHPS